MTDQNRFPLEEETLAIGTEVAHQKDGPAQSELQERILEFERFNRPVMAREQRILDLKKEVNELAQTAGEPAPYGSLDRIEKDEALDNLVQTMKDRDTVSGGEPEELEAEDLLNVEDLQTLLGHFCDAVGVASAIIDLKGKILVFANFCRACTDFHRVGKVSSQRCVESDTILGSSLQEGQDFTFYRCKNGMTDAASPVIIDGKHWANVFIGQFYMEEPEPVFLEYLRHPRVPPCGLHAP